MGNDVTNLIGTSERIDYDGYHEIWKVNDEGVRWLVYTCWMDDLFRKHRDDGPAYIIYYSNGDIKRETWHTHGKKNRSDGPAEIYYKKSTETTPNRPVSKYFWKDGVEINNAVMDAFIGMKAGTPEWEFTWEMI